MWISMPVNCDGFKHSVTVVRRRLVADTSLSHTRPLPMWPLLIWMRK
jgi:hypothetical protein